MEQLRPSLRVFVLAAGLTHALWAGPDGPRNLAELSSGASISGPRNCSGSQGEPAAAIDGEVSGYGPSVGYMWAYLNTPLVVRLKQPASINAVEMLLLDTSSRDYGYLIETSHDGKQWHPAADRSRARDRAWQLHRFEPRRAGMVRVTFTRTSVSVGSYHVVEIAAYDLPAGMTKTPLRSKWETARTRTHMADIKLLGVDRAQTLLDDAQLLNAARALERGKVILRDLDQDGDPDALIYRDRGAIVIALDDNDDMAWQDVSPDGRDDCLAVDLAADGRLDRSIDYMDTDGNGLADVMVQTYVTGSPWGRQALALAVDIDQRGPKRLWSLTPDYGYRQGHCQWQCDFGGDGYFVLFSRDKVGKEWVGSFENPFCFYDPDRDGLPEETVRISGRGRRLRSARYGVNADNDVTDGQGYDYDFSVTALGRVQPGEIEFTRFKLRTGESSGEYMRWESAREAVRTLPWARALLVWDENDHNVALRWGRRERWEGVINASYRGFPQEGGPHCGNDNKRYELDADFSGKMGLYYWSADRRIHLFGAEQGTLSVDYDYDGKTDMVVEYADTDGDGFFDRRELTTRSPAQKRTMQQAGPPTGVIALDYREISAVWPEALKDTLAAQKELLAALGEISGRACLPGGPLDFYQNVTEKRFHAARKIRQSQEARRYYQDVEIELAFAALLRPDALLPKGPGDVRTLLERARSLADQGLARKAAAALRGKAIGQRMKPRVPSPAATLPSPGQSGAFAILGDKITAGWESGVIGYRTYWGKIDVFGKADGRLHLSDFNKPGLNYHKSLGWGMDILHLGATSGVGGLNFWHQGKKFQAQWSKPRDPYMPLQHRVVAAGPAHAAIEIVVEGWTTPLGTLDITRRLVIKRGQRHTVERLTVRSDSAGKVEFGPGLTVFERGEMRCSAQQGYVSAWGDQGIGAGLVGIAVVFDPALCKQIERVGNEVLVHLEANGPSIETQLLLTAAWAQAGRITDRAAWLRYVEALAQAHRTSGGVLPGHVGGAGQ